ncbi:MAG: hypothetical protein ACOX6T_00640 [Myxococcales bacterium]|jgi:hypothetical protein
MIVVFGPYPFADRAANGWMRRIAAVDALFASRERCYVFPSQFVTHELSFEPKIQQVDEKSSFFPIDFRLTGHRRRFLELLGRADFVYAHTMHSAQYLLPYYRSGKIVTDSHGIAPEEALLQGEPQSARMFEDYEKLALEQSAAVVVVTRAMERHYREKYPGLKTRFILMPIHNERPIANSLERQPRERPIVVYAGGTQAWQNVELMMETARRLLGRYQFRFLTDDIEGMKAAATRAGVAEHVTIRRCPPERLAEEYEEADFGFVLRKETAVNRVACPTKLYEYLAYGVVPIAKLPEMGDFIDLGGRCLALDDFSSGKVPGSVELDEIRRANLRVFDRAHELIEQGQEQLRGLDRIAPALDVAAHPALFLTDLERCCFYPASAWCRWTTEDAAGEPVSHQRMVRDLAGPDAALTIELPGKPLRELRARLFDGLPFLAKPTPALVRLANGDSVQVPMKGPEARDASGLWRFESGSGELSLDCSKVPEGAREIRIAMDVLAMGPEASLQPGAARAAPVETELGIRGLSALLARRVLQKARNLARP